MAANILKVWNGDRDAMAARQRGRTPCSSAGTAAWKPCSDASILQHSSVGEAQAGARRRGRRSRLTVQYGLHADGATGEVMRGAIQIIGATALLAAASAGGAAEEKGSRSASARGQGAGPKLRCAQFRDNSPADRPDGQPTSSPRSRYAGPKGRAMPTGSGRSKMQKKSCSRVRKCRPPRRSRSSPR